MSKSNKAGSHQGSKRRKPNKIEIVGIVVILVIAILLLYSNLSSKKPANKEYKFHKDGELTFMDSTGQSLVKIDIQIANSEFDRALGLMFRKSMQMKHGMLFIFPIEKIQSFWMENTEISLDMIFVNKNKEIVTIHKNTKIMSDQTYNSTKPAQYVIEVDAGFCDKFNVKVGDKISWITDN